MDPASIALPDRPLVVRPPSLGVGGIAVIVAAVVAVAVCVVAPVGDLVTDVRFAGKAVPVSGATVEGSCSSGTLFTTCEVTLSAPRRGAPPLRRQVDYLFAELGVEHHTFHVLADPARPSLLTTDLALERLWNRIITLVVSAVLFALGAMAVLLALAGDLRAQRATVRALSRQVVRPVLLRMDSYTLGKWVVAGNRARTWQVPNAARPIVMDPERRLILGITAGDGAFAMPLDRDLRWIGLDDPERRALREALGPDRLGGWLGALDSPAMAAARGRWRRIARTLVIASLVLAAATCGAAWRVFGAGGGDMEDAVGWLGFALCGGGALGCLLGAARVRAKAARHQAILR